MINCNNRIPVNRVHALLLGTGLLLAPVMSMALELPASFDASFEVLRNGKPLGESTISYSVNEQAWQVESRTRGTKGVAKWLKVRESSKSQGTWAETGPKPDHFEQAIDSAVKSVDSSAVFDWPALSVRSEHEDGVSELPLQPGVVDAAAAGVRLRAGLAAGETEWHLQVLDEDEIKAEHFRVALKEPIETALGCLNTVRVDKIRGPESQRYTRTWYAQDLGYVPVRIEHGKTGGNDLTTRLSTLTVDGKVFTQSTGACPAG